MEEAGLDPLKSDVPWERMGENCVEPQFRPLPSFMKRNSPLLDAALPCMSEHNPQHSYKVKPKGEKLNNPLLP